MSQRSKKKANSSFLKNVGKLSSAQIFSLVLGLATAPIFARIYTPEQVGTFSVFLSIVTLITTFGTMRYELAVVLPKDDHDAINIWTGGTLMLFGWAVLLSLSLMLGVEKFLTDTSYSQIIPFLWLIPLAVVLGNINGLITSWLNRKKCFGSNAVSSITASTSNQMGAIGIGSLGYNSVLTLVVVNSASQILGLFVKIPSFWRETSMLWRRVRPKVIWNMLCQYKKFPMVELWSAVLNTISVQLAPLLLVYYFTPEVVGLYAQGMRLIQMPMVLLGQAIGQVFYPKAAEAKLENRLPDLVYRMMEALVLAGIFPFLVLALHGDTIFTVILGSSWAEAGVYAQLLAAWIFLVFCGSPLSATFLVLGRQSVLVLFNLSTVVFRSAALVIGGQTGDPRLTIFFYSAVGVVLWLLLISKLFRIVGLPVMNTWKNYCVSIIPALMAITPLVLIRVVVPNEKASIVAIFIVSALYATYMIWQNPIYKSLFNMLRRQVYSSSTASKKKP